MIIESFSDTSLTTIAPAYLYWQYSDDDDLQAFVISYNSLMQGYLDWFNTTNLADYSSPAISNALLDWVGQGLYGYARPLLITQTVTGNIRGQYGSVFYGKQAYALLTKQIQAGTAVLVSDDVYKRALTWHLYLGDGKQMSMQWMKRRLARFLYGVDGTDISINELQNIQITFTTTTKYISAYGTAFYGSLAYGRIKKSSLVNDKIKITLPNIPLSTQLKSLIDNKFLEIPFQVNLTVSII